FASPEIVRLDLREALDTVGHPFEPAIEPGELQVVETREQVPLRVVDRVRAVVGGERVAPSRRVVPGADQQLLLGPQQGEPAEEDRLAPLEEVVRSADDERRDTD